MWPPWKPTLPLQVALALVMGLVLGWIIAAGTDPPISQPAERPEDCPPCPACPDAVEVPNEAVPDRPPVQTIARSGLPDGPADPPLEWPDALPEHLTPASFDAALREVAVECGFADDLQDVDCSSPPCLAVVMWPTDEDGPSVGTSCLAWAERFGDSTATTTDTVLCEDGTRQKLRIVGPHSPELEERVHRPEPDPGDPWTSMRAFQARIQGITNDLGCGEPGTLMIENRAGHELQWVPKAQ